MAVERIDVIAQTLVRPGRSPDTSAAIVRDGALPHQRTLAAILGTIAERAATECVRPPTIVVGDVVDVAREIEVLRSTGGRGQAR